MKSTTLNIAILLFATFCFSSCSNESSIVSETNTFIKENYVPKLKDPTSYEAISTIVIDTIFRKEQIKKNIEDLIYSRKSAILEAEIKRLEESIIYGSDLDDSDTLISPNHSQILEEKVTKHLNDSMQQVLSKINDSEIGYFLVEHKYKALNGMGLLAPDALILQYNLPNKDITILKNNK
jgi:hypothetical protein